MYHYTLKSSGTVIDKPSQLSAFQEWCPENIEKHPFLLEGMLALAAFHVAYLKPSESQALVPLGLRHQTAALVGFRDTLRDDPTKENCHALFAQSLFLSAVSLAASRYTTTGEVETSINMDTVLEPFMHIRGAGDVCLTAYWWIKTGPFSDVLPGNFLRAEGSLVPSIDNHMSDLKSMIWEKYGGSPMEIHLLGATEALRFIYKEAAFAMQKKYNNPRFVWKWSNLVNQSYVGLLRSHDPGALVIFAHFALLSQAYEEFWYLDGWSKRAIKAVEEAIPEEWKHWTKWPEAQLENELYDFKVSLNDSATSSPVQITSTFLEKRRQELIHSATIPNGH
jgi:hypothetical protein